MPDETGHVEQPRATEDVRLFLANRDVVCVGCGYNLRGTEVSNCPECGRTIGLSLAGSARSRGFLWFVVLALGWVLISSGMNEWRAWKTVREEAKLFRTVVFSLNSRVGAAQSGKTVLSFPRTGAGSSISVTGSGSVSISSGPPGNAGAATPAAPNTLNYSLVTSNSWAALSWWGGLLLVSLAGLIIVAVRRERFEGAHPPRALVAMACVVFALYAGYHAVMFVREVV